MDKRKECNILTRNGCKNTKSRKVVIEVLESSETPMTADDIFIRIKDLGESVNLSTVYRTLELMESKGLVEKVIINENKARFRLAEKGHMHHLICTGCHRMVPIDLCPLKALEKDIGNKTKFDITGHRLELYGLCPECRNEE